MSELPLDSRAPLNIGRLPIGSIGRAANGWWGMMMLVVTESSLFVYLLFAYYYFAARSGPGFLPEALPSFHLSGPGTAILIASSVTLWFGQRGARRGSRAQLLAGLLVTIALGALFVGLQIFEWSEKPYTIASHAYGSAFFTITGFHMAHVVAGLGILLALALWSGLGAFDERRMSAVDIGTIYWHFVDAVWLAVFFTFYITPYLR
ncbi:cytochrome c oxidase subunit 3 [Fulvimarina manganoxydans]|uniref:Cytochrome c oxidase subunit 3 n=1 Tax=Fulvimarina manganoxydans TaxID=937218 RepID=A0A1W2D2I6_9HYPH|nr:cytochrome c oxidase subunit 3 [Fulvimarina manganoxydans]SMC91292.1 cytochrome c oxidase subunit 3 [Fulvimarina manganoxydans]